MGQKNNALQKMAYSNTMCTLALKTGPARPVGTIWF